MTIGNDGASPSRQREMSNDQAQVPPRRSRTRPALIGIAVLILIVGGIYAGRQTGSDLAGSEGQDQTAENKPAPTPPPAAQAPSGSQPPSVPQPAAPERPPSQAAPDQTAQTPAPAERPSAQPQPMRQQSTNLPAESEMMSVRVGSANIRAAPSLRARVVASTRKGARLKVLGHSGKWVHVQADGRNGWINAKMLDPR